MNLSLMQRWQGGFYGAVVSPPGIIPNFSVTDRLTEFTQIIQKLHLSQNLSLTDWQNWLEPNPSQLPFLLFPLALFRHDYPAAFQDQLTLLETAGYVNLEDKAAIAVWFHLLSLIQRERFDPRAKDLTLLPNHDQENFWLTVIIQGLQEHWSVTQLERKLEKASPLSKSLALGLYLWLEIPTQFALSWQRAANLHFPLSLFFTSTLSGLYNGLTGIPSPWCLSSFGQSPSPQNLSQQLYQQWLGALQKEINLATVLSTPNVMQYRPSLKLISQSEL